MKKKELLKDMNRIATVLFESGDMSQHALDVWEGLIVDIENRLVQDGGLSFVSERTCANCHFCVPNIRPTARHDMNLCTREKDPISLTMPPNQYVCNKWCVR